MKKNFEKRLRNYSVVAKDAIAGGRNAEAMVDAVFASLNFSEEEILTSKRTQREIFEIQRKKQLIMKKLREDIRNLDDIEYREELRPGARFVYKKDGVLFARYESGDQDDSTNATELIEEPITFGELMTDGVWGIDYQIDPETVDRMTRKQYLVQSAKFDLLYFLDSQIILEEIESCPDSGKREAYESVAASRESGIVEQGILAEKMVQNFLVKLQYDLDADFTILTADIYQDVSQKIDFIIQRSSRNRGVKAVEEERVGIQFTTDDRPGTKHRKQKQITRVLENLDEVEIDDLVLVSVPLRETRQYFDRWICDGRQAGGPDKLWSLQIKNQILRGLLSRFFTEEEIDELSRRIEE
ncbi:hypothetical protein KJ766_00160 [Patescibacteria group bacterium]|nr:hypothetical protein [Patescibacteria group bacterium]